MSNGTLVPVDPAILQVEAWEAVLACLCVGFLLGLMSNIKTGGGGRYFTVALAQIPYQFQEFRVPLLPRCVLMASLAGSISVSNADFASAHLLFVGGMIILCISVGVWLYAASRELARDEKLRKREIEDSIANPDATVPVPDHMRGELPGSFHVWNRVNNLLFVLLALRAAVPVFVFVWKNHHIATD